MIHCKNLSNVTRSGVHGYDRFYLQFAIFKIETPFVLLIALNLGTSYPLYS